MKVGKLLGQAVSVTWALASGMPTPTVVKLIEKVKR